MPRLLLLATMLLMGGAAAPGAEPPQEPVRHYHNGPLTAEDFRGEPKKQYSAWTEVDSRYEFRYRHASQGAMRVATLTEIDIWAVMLPEKSYNRRPNDPLLLDHEQGHFDLLQIGCLEARLKLSRELKTADVLQGRGRSVPEAVKKLEEKIVAALATFVEQARAASIEYDKETANGTNAQAQALARQAQRKRLADLTADLEKTQ